MRSRRTRGALWGSLHGPQEGEGPVVANTPRRKIRVNMDLPNPRDFDKGLLWLRKDKSTRPVTNIHQLRWPTTELETRRLVAEALRPQRWIALEKVLAFIRASTNAGPPYSRMGFQIAKRRVPVAARGPPHGHGPAMVAL